MEMFPMQALHTGITWFGGTIFAGGILLFFVTFTKEGRKLETCVIFHRLSIILMLIGIGLKVFLGG
jgi:hypothetical protein